MRTRQAKKILKDYVITYGWIRWTMPSLIAAMRVARRRRWTVAHCRAAWTGGKAKKRKSGKMYWANFT